MSPRLPVPRRLEQTLDAALDYAIAIQRPVVVAHVARMRRMHPRDTPADTVSRLERQYLTAVVGIGGASGAAAALPGFGTGAVLVSGAAEVTAFVSASAIFVLALAELHDMPVDDVDLRRALVLSVLVGEGGAETLAALGRGEKHWGEVFSLSSQQKDKIAGINQRLAALLFRRFGPRQGVLMVGRALPLGVGAAIGAGGNAALARSVVSAARRTFGPTPGNFGPRVVEAAPDRRPRPWRGSRR
jgi:hypothetical protein